MQTVHTVIQVHGGGIQPRVTGRYDADTGELTVSVVDRNATVNIGGTPDRLHEWLAAVAYGADAAASGRVVLPLLDALLTALHHYPQMSPQARGGVATVRKSIADLQTSDEGGDGQ